MDLINLLLFMKMLNVQSTSQPAIGIFHFSELFPDSKVHGANMGPIWGRQDPGGPHDGPMNIAIWVDIHATFELFE